MTFVVMMCYLFIFEKHESGIGIKKAMKLWFSSFRRSFDFRLLFFLVFYSAMIGFRTLLGRGLFQYPLNNVMGSWELFIKSDNTVVSTYGIENILLFVPFSFLLLWFLNTRKNRKGIVRQFVVSIAAAFLFSLIIEFSQLVFCLGTFQLADIVYNTAGGAAGSLIYLLIWGIVFVIKKLKKNH